MAYVAPNSIIELFGDVGLSDNYTDTYYFASETGANGKDAYFTALPKVGVSLTPLSYLREERNQVKVQLPMSQIYSARYMRFKNTSFENKWFYAFIKNIEYINNECSCIHYELDPLMTWMGKFTLGECFIERQHTTSDAIGEHIIDENIPCGDYVDEFCISSGFIGSNGFYYCFASTFDPEDPVTDVQGETYGGIYSGIKYSYTDSVQELNTWIAHATEEGKSDGIVGIAIVPRSFMTFANEGTVEKAQTFTKPYTDIDGYTNVRNNKLFTFPYKSLQVTNLEGNFADFRYEFFGGNSAQFEFIGCTGLSTEIICAPVNYKNLSKNITEKMSMSDFPMCSYNVDAFKAYLAQNKSSIAANALSALIQMNSDFNRTGSLGMELTPGTSGIQQVARMLGTMSDYARKPPQAGGAQGTSALFGRPLGFQMKDFWFVGKTITREYAKVIDDYFTAFGYKINEVAIPNMNARPHWTYVKTIGCQVDGAIPADDASTIENIFNAGIRFWNKNDTIGDYSADNSPATP